jgi:hypothetical protein
MKLPDELIEVLGNEFRLRGLYHIMSFEQFIERVIS